MNLDELLLTEAELRRLSGYRQASKQVKELHRLGYYRARRSPLGGVILERTHYEAITSALVKPKPETPARVPLKKLAKKRCGEPVIA